LKNYKNFALSNFPNTVERILVTKTGRRPFAAALEDTLVLGKGHASQGKVRGKSNGKRGWPDIINIAGIARQIEAVK